MAALKHFNPKAGSLPYKGLFSNVTIVPPGVSIAYISTQWAADPTTGELIEGLAGDYNKQAAVTWKGVVDILMELGCTLNDVVHRTVMYLEYNDDIGKMAAEGYLSVLPDKWKKDAFNSALTFNGVGHFHRPGVVFGVDLVVAVPNQNIKL